MKSRRRRVLVAGGGGFIGSHLCEALLDAGHDVICVDNFFTGNKENIRHLLSMAKRLRIKALLASTSEVYGDPDVHPQPETYWGRVNPVGPRACYDEGKRCAETLFFDYRRQHKLDIRVARIFNTYGPRMSENDGRVVSNFILQALMGSRITIYGDGQQTRSFCYVDDMVGGLRALMDVVHEESCGPINLGNPEECSMLQLAETISGIIGTRVQI